MKKIVINDKKNRMLVEIIQTYETIRAKCASYITPLTVIVTLDNGEEVKTTLK